MHHTAKIVNYPPLSSPKRKKICTFGLQKTTMKLRNILFILLFLASSSPLFAQVEDLDAMVEVDSTETDTIAINWSEVNADHSCARVDSIVNFALTKLGKRYKYGSAGPYTFDCSGLMYFTFKHFGITLQRSSRQQYTMGKKVKKNDIRKGDLVFFLRGKQGHRYIGHVGLVISVDSLHNFKFVHASSPKYGVRIDESTKAAYARSFAGARRIIECNGENQPYIIPDEPITEDLVIAIDSTHNDTIPLLPRVQTPEQQKAQSNVKYHYVKLGETLSAISRKYHVSVANLVKWNNLKNPDRLSINQRLKIYR